jgi:hypothetical protein
LAIATLLPVRFARTRVMDATRVAHAELSGDCRTDDLLGRRLNERLRASFIAGADDLSVIREDGLRLEAD